MDLDDIWLEVREVSETEVEDHLTPVERISLHYVPFDGMRQCIGDKLELSQATANTYLIRRPDYQAITYQIPKGPDDSPSKTALKRLENGETFDRAADTYHNSGKQGTLVWSLMNKLQQNPSDVRPHEYRDLGRIRERFWNGY